MPPEGVPPRHALESFLLEGRFSLRQGEQNHSGRIGWRHSAQGDEILLASPFGQGIAEIVAVPGQATLTAADGRRFTAPDAASLIERALGYGLPLERLADWVRARAADADVVERDALGRPLRLRVDGWRVEYGYGSDEAQALPASIFAGRDGAFELRLRIDGWRGSGD
jgi:outer membrane lipoprotein LolB